MPVTGEGFQTFIIKEDGDRQQWDKLAIHYTDVESTATENRDDAIWPEDLISKEEYKKFSRLGWQVMKFCWHRDDLA